MTVHLIADDGKTCVDVSLISVDDRLPTLREAEHLLLTFYFNRDGDLKGIATFYCPAIGWMLISGPDEKGECHFYDITKIVEYWAMIPDEFLDEFWDWEGGTHNGQARMDQCQ